MNITIIPTSSGEIERSQTLFTSHMCTCMCMWVQMWVPCQESQITDGKMVQWLRVAMQHKFLCLNAQPAPI